MFKLSKPTKYEMKRRVKKRYIFGRMHLKTIIPRK
jgi:hypothetical protein